MSQVRLTVRVKPGASRTRVLGAFGGTCDEPPALIVAVNAPPVDGRANEAVIAALAAALQLRPRQVQIVSGHTARTKRVCLEVDEDQVDAVQATIRTLLADARPEDGPDRH